MISATTDQFEQILHRLVLQNDYLNLEEQTAIVKNYFMNTAGSHLIGWEIFRWIEALSKSGINDKVLKTGDSVSDFTLASVNGGVIRLKDRLWRGPVVAVFYRGVWCPFCNLQLRAIQQRLYDIKKLHASVLAISPQTPDHSLEIIDRLNLEFYVLSDIGNMVARKFGLVYRLPDNIANIYQYLDIMLPTYNGDDLNELPITSVFVIDRKGKIAQSFFDVDFTHRTDPDDIIDVLMSLRK